MGGGQSSWVLASAETWGTWGSGGLPGHMLCCPKLHPTGNQPVSSPQARPWEAAHPGGKEEAAIQILIQILEATGSKSFPIRPLCSLPRAALLLPRLQNSNDFRAGRWPASVAGFFQGLAWSVEGQHP